PAIKTLKSGTAMNKLEESDDGKFIKISLQDGKEGWVPDQYTVDKPIAANQLQGALARAQKVEDQNKQLKNELSELRKQLASLQKDHNKLSRNFSKVEKENSRIKEVSKKPIALAEENDSLRSNNVAMEKDLQMLRQELQILDDRTDREWFMIGGAVMAGGVILGIILPMFVRRRKRDGWGSI
ncbi:MAG: TIGR04211 family SH3 domain-containing protein, partial [Gammaproteobacteria bacterium]|nr:TIGR04211 family SH3 domain-containing protein [Gammaproteobacteria bacterium]